MRLLALLLCLFFATPALAVGVDADQLADPAKEAQAREIMKNLRCLVCQNQSIEDSNADLAKDLRHVVRERVALGETPDQVQRYMVDRYGDWVLLSPPVKTDTLMLWGAPALLVGLGGLAAWASLRRRRPAAAPERLSSEELAELKRLEREA
jgi:cytochrome c-type biogenesis protein CcmH